MTETKPVKKIPIHFQSAQNRLYIKNGKVVNADSTQRADIYIEDGIIKYVGSANDFTVPGGTRVINAAGRYVFPGGIDPNTSFNFQFNDEIPSADDLYQGTKAAIFGGTTTILNVVYPKKGESLIDTIYDWRKLADSKVCLDYSLIFAISSWSRSIKDDMKMLSEKHGINLFMFQYLNDSELYEAFEFCKELGIVPLIHAENLDISSRVAEKLLEQGVGGPDAYETSRNDQLEAEYVHRACVIANQVEVPIYVTKISSKDSAFQITKAKRSNKYPVFGETVASSLASVSLKDNRIYYVSNPPIRQDPENSRILIKHLALGDISTTASNNCTFKREQKEMGLKDFSKILPGVNGAEDRMSVLWEKGVHNGLISVERFVEITSTNVAKIFNLFPKKGAIKVNSDADLLVWNPDATRTVASKKDHQGNDFNIFEGMSLHGAPDYVIQKGRVCYEEEVGLRVIEGFGRFLDIKPNSSHAYQKGADGVEEIDSNGASHEDNQAQVDFEEHHAVRSVLSEGSQTSTTTNHTSNTHTARAKRPEGQRNMQESSFSVNEALNTPEAHRSTIRVRNPPGGASSGLW